MKYEQALAQVVKEGAIRIFRISGAWSIAYRIKKGEIERRGIHRNDKDDWTVADHMIGMTVTPRKNGWYPVEEIHHQAVPIESESAMNNPGYDYQVLIRQCQTCKLDQPTKAFERDMQSEMGFRTWECNDCAKDRSTDTKTNLKLVADRSGDYLTRKTHTSKPPIESEI